MFLVRDVTSPPGQRETEKAPHHINVREQPLSYRRVEETGAITSPISVSKKCGYVNCSYVVLATNRN
jgi:hypothetical protein